MVVSNRIGPMALRADPKIFPSRHFLPSLPRKNLSDVPVKSYTTDCYARVFSYDRLRLLLFDASFIGGAFRMRRSAVVTGEKYARANTVGLASRHKNSHFGTTLNLDGFPYWLGACSPRKLMKNKATHRGRVTVALPSEFAVGDDMFHSTGDAETIPPAYRS